MFEFKGFYFNIHLRLLKNKRICPQCRKKVFASNERGARLISGSGGSDSDDEPANERAPLLRQQVIELQVTIVIGFILDLFRACLDHNPLASL